jgi:hypothetical protein
VRDSDEGLRSRALAIMKDYADLTLSHADCVGVAIAREFNADAVFG